MEDDLPDINRHSEDEGEWNSSIGSDDFGGRCSKSGGGDNLSEDSDVEMPYETAPRPRRPSWDENSDDGVQRLPIKLLDGKVKNVGTKLRSTRDGSREESDKEEAAKEPTPEPREDATLGSRLGRRSVVDVVTIKSRRERIYAVKEQIAGICQEVIGDPEDSVRRLYSVRIIIIQFHCSSFPCFAVCTILA